MERWQVELTTSANISKRCDEAVDAEALTSMPSYWNVGEEGRYWTGYALPLPSKLAKASWGPVAAAFALKNGARSSFTTPVRFELNAKAGRKETAARKKEGLCGQRMVPGYGDKYACALDAPEALYVCGWRRLLRTGTVW